VMAFAIRGLLRGITSQVFAVLGLVGGLWVAGWVSQWVGTRWQGAYPAAGFLVLRWLMVASAALTVAALVHWWGELARSAIKATPVGWLDRPVGLVLGAALGAVVATFALLGLLLAPWPPALPGAAASSRTARPMLVGGVEACSFVARYIPGGEWLKRRFLAAVRRVDRYQRPS